MNTASEEIASGRASGRGKVLWVVTAVVLVVVAIVGYVVAAGWFAGAAPVTLVGKGATFPDPLIQKWSSVYANVTGGSVRVNYQGIGSGGGIAQITAKTVDFAGSDAPLKPSERAAAPGLLHIPETIGAVTAAYNLPGIGTGLNLTGPVLVEIYFGNVTSWDDPSITSLNPSVTLSSQPISVVHRSDGSGTTFVWTSWLHMENPGTWNATLVGKSINWPVGIGSSGNAGVAGSIRNTPYAIGYVELAYTIQNQMTVAKIRNPAGNFIMPSLDTTAAAAAGAAPSLPAPAADWANVSILDAPGANSYPVATFTYLLVYKELNTLGSSMTQPRAQALVNFLWWAVHDGQTYSAALTYVPLPSAVVTLDEGAIRSITYNGQTLHT